MQHGHYVHLKDPDYDETKEEPDEVGIYKNILNYDNILVKLTNALCLD